MIKLTGVSCSIVVCEVMSNPKSTLIGTFTLIPLTSHGLSPIRIPAKITLNLPMV